MFLYELIIDTTKREDMIDITRDLRKYVKESIVQEGILVVFSMHTTAGLTVNENADDDVKFDMIKYWQKQTSNQIFQHNEGNSDAHIKTTVFGPSLSLIIHKNEIVLGQWQGVYFCEFDGPRRRVLKLKIING